MTNDRRRPPMTEQEMQVTPLPGEVDPKDAVRLARHFAVVTRLQQEAAERAWAAKNEKTAETPSKFSGKK